MGPKKKKGGKGKKGKKGGIDPDDLKAYNLGERQVVMDLYDRMEELKERNDELKEQKAMLQNRKDLEEQAIVSNLETVVNLVCLLLQEDGSTWYANSIRKKGAKNENFTKVIE